MKEYSKGIYVKFKPEEVEILHDRMKEAGVHNMSAYIRKMALNGYKIDISKSQNGITTIWLNNIHFKNFLKELWNTLQKTLDNGNWLHR